MGLRRIFKRTMTVICLILVSPWALLAQLESLVSPGERIFTAGAEVLSLVPTLLGNYLRLGYYIVTLQSCGFDVAFDFGSRVSHRTARLGNDITVGGFASLGTVTVGDHVLISPRVSVLSGGRQHEVWDPERNVNDQPPHYDRVHIAPNSWIGEGAIVLADVGERCIVAAGAVVLRPVPDEKLAMGNPARAMAKNWNASGATSKDEAAERVSP